jgi:3-hydroxybutyryl-CoA dehydrogenase
MIEVRRVGVLGAGIMGSGIAQVCAQGGYQVILRDVSQKFLDKGLATIQKSLGIMQNKGKISAEQVDEILARIKLTTDSKEAVADADLVIEAVPENLELKKQIFTELDKICPPHTILGTNTSSLRITEIASVTARPDKVIGIHFANPVPVMVAVEIIRGLHTADETLEVVQSVCKQIGKETFVAQDIPGFAANRLFTLLINEAFYVVWEGIATPEDVDKACKLGLGHAMGPLESGDFSGLDTILSGLEYLHREIGEKYRPCPLLKQLVAAGHLGRKTGRGVYTYNK